MSLATVVADSTAKYDIITPHITNGDHMEIPWILPPFFKEITLPHWEPVHLGPLTLDLSPTKHVVFLLLGATLLILVMLLVASALVKSRTTNDELARMIKELLQQRHVPHPRTAA